MARIKPFERYPGQYDNWFVANRFAYRSELRAVEKLLPKQGVGVEIGVGGGRFAQPLGIRFGVDPSPNMCRLAMKRGVRVAEAVSEALPFRDESFDFALMVTTICFVDDARSALQEAQRILRPGGCIVIGMVDKESPLGRAYLRMKSGNEFYRIATFYSTDEVKERLEEIGFGGVDVVQTVFGGLEEIDEVQACREGYGEGGFVAIKATKRERGAESALRQLNKKPEEDHHV